MLLLTATGSIFGKTFLKNQPHIVFFTNLAVKQPDDRPHNIGAKGSELKSPLEGFQPLHQKRPLSLI